MGKLRHAMLFLISIAMLSAIAGQSPAQRPIDLESEFATAPLRQETTHAPTTGVSPLPLTRPQVTTSNPLGGDGQESLWMVGKALALVLGLFFGAIWAYRRVYRSDPGATAPQVFKTLGKFPLTARKHATVVRFGNRLLVLSETPRGLEKLAEVTSAEEIEQITALCSSTVPSNPISAGQAVSTVEQWMQRNGLESGTTSPHGGVVN